MTYVDDALSKNEDAVGVGRKGTIDQPYKLRAPFWTVDTLFYAVPKAGNDIEFVLCCFQRINWKAKDESTGLPSLSKSAINNTRLLTPRSGEQVRIGALFAKIDSLIALHQRERVESRLQVKTTFQDKSSQQIIGSHAHFECGDRRTLDGREVFARSRRIHAVNQLVEAAELVKALFFHSGGQQLRQQRRIYTKQAGRLPNLRILGMALVLRHIVAERLARLTKTSPL